jgi:hypothetical protein
MWVGGVVFELPPPELLTAVSECSSLPTPAARDGDKRGMVSAEHAARRVANPDRSVNLEDAIALLPTPTANEPGGTAERYVERARAAGASPSRPTNLAWIAALLPTPTAQDANASGGNPNTTGSHGTTLTDAALATGGRTRGTNRRSADGKPSSGNQTPNPSTAEGSTPNSPAG